LLGFRHLVGGDARCQFQGLFQLAVPECGLLP
jgi:hypothetical protein